MRRLFWGVGDSFIKDDIFTYTLSDGTFFVSECQGNSNGPCIDLASSTEKNLAGRYHLSAISDLQTIKKINRKDLILYSNLKYKTDRFWELIEEI
jgi:hypothetical protein